MTNDYYIPAWRCLLLAVVLQAQRDITGRTKATSDEIIDAWEFLCGDGLADVALLLGRDPVDFCYRTRVQTLRLSDGIVI